MLAACQRQKLKDNDVMTLKVFRGRRNRMYISNWNSLARLSTVQTEKLQRKLFHLSNEIKKRM
jgi:hypothetical protein